MVLFKKKNEKQGFFQAIENVLSHFGILKKESFFERNAIHFLNFAQFFGVVNDNFFKYLIVFFLIDFRGIKAAPFILTSVGIIYVLPFLLFSSGAGVLADKFSKQRMIVLLKFIEVILMAFGVIAFTFKSEWVCYMLLFLLSMHSAIFGPPKYSIIPELVNQDKISKANGLITSLTYIGIIVGTFLASFLTEITKRNFSVSALVATLLAALGFIAAILIPKTTPKHSKRQVNPLFLYELYKTLRYAARTPYLVVAILGSATFFFIGAYFQLNVIPYATQSMGYTEVAGGYLFLLTAVGIACGALLGGKLSRHRPEIGLACISGIILSILLLLLGFFYFLPPFVFAALFLLGVFGGIYIVPFDSFIQKYASEHRRGQIVAAANFLSFCGVLVAPLLLYFFSNILRLTAAQGFMITGVLIFLLVISLTSRLSGYFFNYIARIFVKPLYTFNIENLPFDQGRSYVLVWEKIKWIDIALLASSNPNLHFYFPRLKKKYRDFFLHLFSAVDFIYVKETHDETLSTFMKKIKKHRHQIPCLLFPYAKFFEEKSTNKLIRELKKIEEFDLINVQFEKILIEEQAKRQLFKRTQVILKFNYL